MSLLQRKAVGFTIKQELLHRLAARKHLHDVVNQVSFHGLMRFDRCCLRLMGVHRELKSLLENDISEAIPCQAGRCQMQWRADRLFKASYAYLSSVLILFETLTHTGIVVQRGPDERLGTINRGKGLHSYLLPNELTDLVNLINEMVEEALTDEQADYPNENEDADELPGIYHTVRRYGYDSLCDLPLTSFSTEQTFAYCWANRFRFEVTELRMEPESAPGRFVLTGRGSRRHWYCGRCLSDRIEHYCLVSRRQQRRRGLLRAVKQGRHV